MIAAERCYTNYPRAREAHARHTEMDGSDGRKHAGRTWAGCGCADTAEVQHLLIDQWKQQQ
jgi:hypothetical protein